MIRNIRYGIKNIIDYFPIVWRDRDWDSAYIVDFISKKLQRMLKRKYTETIVDAEWWVNYLRIASILAKRYIDSAGGDEKVGKTMYSIIHKRSQWWWD